jgi:antitoxin VapB
MSTGRRVRLFRNGRNQALLIPRGFDLAADEAVIRREGERLVNGPASPVSLLAVLASLEPLDDAFPAIPQLPTCDVDL